MTPDDMHIRRMTRDELDTLVEWAAREGWNPGLDDAEVFWNTDPNGFVAAEISCELVGGGSIVAYASATVSWVSSLCVLSAVGMAWVIVSGTSASGGCWRASTLARLSACPACLTSGLLRAWRVPLRVS